MRSKPRNRSFRSGMALLLVIPAVALAVVLSYAVLTNTGIQNQMSSNAQLLTQADSAAQSGINYGLYALQQEVANQSIAPISFTTSSQTGGPQQSFTVSVISTKVGLTISSTVSAIGTVARDANTQMKRTALMKVQLNLSADFGSSGSTGILASQAHSAGIVSSGQLAVTNSSGTMQPVTSIHVLNWAQ